MHDAFNLWLASIKRVPSVYDLKLAPIYSLFYNLPPSRHTDERILALQQGIEVYLRETTTSSDPSGVIMVRQGNAQFSNFWRLNDMCVTFQATVAPENILVVHLTSSVSRLDIGYKVVSDQFGSKIIKNEKVLISSQDTGAITPGSAELFSSYMICFDSVKGDILFGRSGRVIFAYKDPNPSPALFYGFTTTGPAIVALTGTRMIPVSEVTCPAYQTHLCGGPDRGVCLESKICQCKEQYKGFACHLDCPLDDQGAVCGGQGQCTPNGGSGRPFCTCKAGYLGTACEINEIPSVMMEFTPSLVSNNTVSGSQSVVLLSSRVTAISYSLQAYNSKALSISPSSVVFLVQDADHFEPIVLSGETVSYTFIPGVTTVTAKVSFPNNPDVATASIQVMVNDCICSGKGACNAQGKCVCDASALGDFCEDDLISGVAVVGPSASEANHKFFYIPFARSLGDVMKSINFVPYMVSHLLIFLLSKQFTTAN
jgi:hypothetical protein